MRVHSVMQGSRANGPGLRSVVWFQGCGMAPLCPGCQNPLTHSFTKGGFDVTPEDLAVQVVREAAVGTEGITISGGEPMHQGLSLYAFMSMIRAIRPSWNIGLFTGYTLTELTCGQYDLREPLPNLGTQEHAKACLWEYQIKDALTFAVTGRYDRTRPVVDVDYSLSPHKRLCSSLNQTLWLFRSRYNYEDFPALTMEVSIDDTGFTTITGFPVV